MKLGAEDILEVLEYNKIVEIAAKQCFGVPGRQALSDSKPKLKYVKINQLLDEVNEFKNILLGEKEFPLGSYRRFWMKKGKSNLMHLKLLYESVQLREPRRSR